MEAAHAAAPRSTVAPPPSQPWATGEATWRSAFAAPRLAHATDPRERAGALYRQYGPVVYRRCMRLLHNPEAALDATQEVFVKLVASADRLPPDAPALAWLYRVTSNHCLNVRRAGRHRGEGKPEGDLEVLEAAPGRDLPDLALVRQVLARYDEVTRLVAVGVLVDGMEHEEVAVVLGISRRSVARKLERFLDTARRFLAATGEGRPGSQRWAG